MPRVDKNNNGKRNPNTYIIGKKAIKLSKKKTKLEKLQEATKRTTQKEDLHNSNLTGITKQLRLKLHHDEEI
jgi:hypothetical protein